MPTAIKNPSHNNPVNRDQNGIIHTPPREMDFQTPDHFDGSAETSARIIQELCLELVGLLRCTPQRLRYGEATMPAAGEREAKTKQTQDRAARSRFRPGTPSASAVSGSPTPARQSAASWLRSGPRDIHTSARNPCCRSDMFRSAS